MWNFLVSCSPLEFSGVGDTLGLLKTLCQLGVEPECGQEWRCCGYGCVWCVFPNSGWFISVFVVALAEMLCLTLPSAS